MNEEIFENGVMGEFAGWNVGGKTYDPDGNEVEGKHAADCFCCRASLLTPSSEAGD